MTELNDTELKAVTDAPRPPSAILIENTNRIDGFDGFTAEQKTEIRRRIAEELGIMDDLEREYDDRQRRKAGLAPKFKEPAAPSPLKGSPKKSVADINTVNGAKRQMAELKQDEGAAVIRRVLESDGSDYRGTMIMQSVLQVVGELDRWFDAHPDTVEKEEELDLEFCFGAKIREGVYCRFDDREPVLFSLPRICKMIGAEVGHEVETANFWLDGMLLERGLEILPPDDKEAAE